MATFTQDEQLAVSSFDTDEQLAVSSFDTDEQLAVEGGQLFPGIWQGNGVIGSGAIMSEASE